MKNIYDILSKIDFEKHCEQYALGFQRDTDTPTMTRFRQENMKEFCFSLIQKFYEIVLQDHWQEVTALEQKRCNSKMIECKCAVCGEKFMARVADRNRGWAKCCSKSCAATLSNKKTGKYRKHLACQNKMDNLGYENVDYYDDSHLFGDE